MVFLLQKAAREDGRPSGGRAGARQARADAGCWAGRHARFGRGEGRARELAPLDFTTSNIKSPAAAPAAPAMVSPSDFSDLSESPEGFHVEMDVDPVEADVEQAAVLYANGQDAATGAVLENAVHVHHFGPGNASG